MVVGREEQPASDESRDLGRLTGGSWPSGEFPLTVQRGEDVVPVVVRQSVLQAVHRHGDAHLDVEICGVLVGKVYRDEVGPFVCIEHHIRGDHAGSEVAQVTFTGATWNHIHTVMDRAFPEKRILGWYHTHPGFGIFLSPMDMFIQENFFNAPEQVALVYDPLAKEEGLFVWKANDAVRNEFLVEPDGEGDSVAQGDDPHGGTATAISVPKSDNQQAGLVARLRELERANRRLRIGLIVVLAVMMLSSLGLLFIAEKFFLSSGADEPLEQKVQEGHDGMTGSESPVVGETDKSIPHDWQRSPTESQVSRPRDKPKATEPLEPSSTGSAGEHELREESGTAAEVNEEEVSHALSEDTTITIEGNRSPDDP